MAAEPGGTGPQPGDELRNMIQQLRDGLADVGRLLGQAARQKVDEFKTAATETTRPASQPAADHSPAQEPSAAETASDVIPPDLAYLEFDAVKKLVREKPVQSLLVAGSLGLLVGVVLGRR